MNLKQPKIPPCLKLHRNKAGSYRVFVRQFISKIVLSPLDTQIVRFFQIGLYIHLH